MPTINIDELPGDFTDGDILSAAPMDFFRQFAIDTAAFSAQFDGGVDGQVLSTDGAGNLSWIDAAVTEYVDIVVEDSLTVNGTFEVTGDSTLTGELSLVGNSTVTGDIEVTGDINLTGELSVTGGPNVFTNAGSTALLKLVKTNASAVALGVFQFYRQLVEIGELSFKINDQLYLYSAASMLIEAATSMGLTSATAITLTSGGTVLTLDTSSNKKFSFVTSDHVGSMLDVTYGASRLYRDSIPSNTSFTYASLFYGLVYENTTAAATGSTNQQYSPLVALVSQGWNSSGSASQKLGFATQVRPVETAGTITGALHWLHSQNAGTWTSIAQLSNGGQGRFRIGGDATGSTYGLISAIYAEGGAVDYAMTLSGGGLSATNWINFVKSGSNIFGAIGYISTGQMTIDSWANNNGFGLQLKGRLCWNVGTNVTSAATLVLPYDGPVHHVTGTTNVTRITSTDHLAGAIFILIFDGVLTISSGTAASGADKGIKLNGSTFLTTAAGTMLGVMFDGTDFQEIFRKIP